MTVTRPTDWKGSDLRSRTEVVRYLAERGGVVEDKTGLAVGTMREQLGRGRALTQLIADMEADGMIRREVRGRRTFKIELLDDWGLVPKVVPPAPSDTGVPEGTDYDQLAEALLAITLRRATAPVAQPEKPNGQLKNRLQRAERTLEEANGQILELKHERDVALRRVVELEEVTSRLEHNLEVLQREQNKRPTGPTISERLSQEEREMLAQLQQALPEHPTSTPRKQRTR